MDSRRLTFTDDAWDRNDDDGQATNIIDDEHVFGVWVAGDGRQLISIEVRADSDRDQSDASVSDQLRLTQRGRLVGRRIVGDDDNQLGHRCVADTGAVRRHEDWVACQR